MYILCIVYFRKYLFRYIILQITQVKRERMTEIFSFPKPRNFKDVDGALPFLRNVNIIISTVDSRRTRLVYFSSLPTVRNGRGFNQASTGLSPQPLSSVRGKRFFPQFPRDCLLRKFSTPIDCPLLGQIIFIIFLSARPLTVRATLWPPRNEAAQPFMQPLHLLAVNFY